MNLGATLILICLIQLLIANKLSVTNVRLPIVSNFRKQQIYFVVKAYNGQFNWVSSNPDILRVDYNNDGTESQCKIILNTNQPYQHAINIQAINIKNGEKLNVEATISAIHKIEIRTRDKYIDLDSIEELRVEGQDLDRNTFSTLEGVPLIWQIDDQMLQVLTYDQANVQNTQRNLSQSDFLLVKGIKTGKTTVSVVYNHGDISRGDIFTQAEFKICENLQIFPFFSTINLPTSSTYKFGLFSLFKTKQIANGIFINISKEIQLPNNNFLWESNLKLNENQLTTTNPVFGQKIEVKSKLYEHPETSIIVNVLVPQSISVKFLEEKYRNTNLFFDPINHEVRSDYLLKNTSYIIIPIYLGQNGEEIRTQDQFIISTLPDIHKNFIIKSDADLVKLTLTNGNFQKTFNLKFVNPLVWKKLGNKNYLNVPAGEVISVQDVVGGSGHIALGSTSLYSRLITGKIHFDREGEESMELRDENNHEITFQFNVRIFNPAGLQVYEQKKEMYIEQSEFVYFGAFGYLNQQKYYYDYCNSLNLKITGQIDVNITDIDNPIIDEVCVGYNIRPKKLGRQVIEVSVFNFLEKMEIFGISYLSSPYQIVYMSLNSKFELPLNGGPQDWDLQQTRPELLSCSGETQVQTVQVIRQNNADKQLRFPKQGQLSVLQYCENPTELRISHKNKIITWINGKIAQSFQVIGMDQQGHTFVSISGLKVDLDPISPLEIINNQLVVKQKMQKVQLFVKSKYQNDNLISSVKYIKTLNELDVYYDLSIQHNELVIGQKDQINIVDGSGDFTCFVDQQPVICKTRVIQIEPKNYQHNIKIIDNIMEIQKDYQLQTKRLSQVRVVLAKQYLVVGEQYDLEILIHDKQLSVEDHDKFQLSRLNDLVGLVKIDDQIKIKALKQGVVQISFTYKSVESNTLLFYNFEPYKFEPLYVQVNCVTEIQLPQLVNTLEYKVISNYTFVKTQIFNNTIRFFTQDTYDKEFDLDIEITNQKEIVQVTKIRTFLVTPNRVQILFGNRAVQQGALIKLISQLYYNDIRLYVGICNLNYKWQLADQHISELNQFFTEIVVTKSQVVKLEVGLLRSEVWIDVIKDKIPQQIFPNQQTIWQGPILLPQYSEYKSISGSKLIKGKQITLRQDSIITSEQSKEIQTLEYNDQLVLFQVQQPFQVYIQPKVFIKKQESITIELFLLNQEGRAFEKVLNPEFKIFIVYRPIVEVSVDGYFVTIKAKLESGSSIIKIFYQNIEDYLFVNVGQFIYPDGVDVYVGSTINLSSESEDQNGRWESDCGYVQHTQLTINRLNKCLIEYHDKFGQHQAYVNVVKPERLEYQVSYFGNIMNITFSFPKLNDAISFNAQFQCKILSNKEWFKVVSVKPFECLIEPLFNEYGSRMPKYIELDVTATSDHYKINERINQHFIRNVHIPTKKIDLGAEKQQDYVTIKFYQKPSYQIDFNIQPIVRDIYNQSSETLVFEFDSYPIELRAEQKRIEGRIWFTESGKRNENDSILVTYQPTESDWYANVILVGVFTGIYYLKPKKKALLGILIHRFYYE